jgi:hypothetical protein
MAEARIYRCFGRVMVAAGFSGYAPLRRRRIETHRGRGLFERATDFNPFEVEA